jgi:hypothetical protein
MKLKIELLALIIITISCKKNETTISNSQTESDSCEDMESYNQGIREGRGQRGVLIDCETYYPYEGWADNKRCYCKGFNKGQKE